MYFRLYIHKCAGKQGSNTKTTTAICPVCGETGSRCGWGIGIFDRMARFRKTTGVPPVGIHLRFLPDMSEICETCEGEGILEGDRPRHDTDCPICEGTGQVSILKPEEKDKVTAWANRRFERSRHEEVSEWKRRDIPGNFWVTRSGNFFVDSIMAHLDDVRKYGDRNKKIGALMLRAEGSRWDFFMELIEKWESLGGGLAVRRDEIRLCLLIKYAIGLAVLVPGAEHGAGALRLRWKELENYIPTEERIYAYQNEVSCLAPGRLAGVFRRVQVTDGMGLEEAHILLRAMKYLCGF